MPLASGAQTTPPTRAITLWTHLVDVNRGADEGWLRMLDEEERSRAARLPLGMDRTRFIARRAMLREVLAAAVQREPGDLRFRYGAFGKPALALNGSAQVPGFNMSHSGDLVVLAVCGPGDIGVDVEEVLPISENVAGLFSGHEQRQLAALPAAQVSHAFYRYWTAKEAVLKLIGSGLSLSPEDVAITDPNDPLRVLSIEGNRAAASTIHLYPFAPLDRFSGTIAVRSPHIMLRHESWPCSVSRNSSRHPRID